MPSPTLFNAYNRGNSCKNFRIFQVLCDQQILTYCSSFPLDIVSSGGRMVLFEV